MSSFIEEAAKALKKKEGGLTTYRVSFSTEETYDIVVDAKDEDEAKEIAWEESNNGNFSSNSGDTEITNISVE